MTKYSICKCGCGKEVTNENNMFLNGHNTKGSKQSGFTILKRKQTCINVYGVEDPNQLKEIKEKRIKTCLKNHGVEYSMQSEEVKEKSKQTCLKKYGTEYSLQSEEIREKIKQTCINNYGVEYSSQSTEMKEHSKQTCLKNYGVDNYSKTFEFRQFAREQLVKDVENGLKNNELFSPRKGKQEEIILNEFEILSSFKLPIRNSNLISYFPDGRNDEHKIIVEIYEPWHKNTWAQKHDFKRQIDLESLGYKYFVIWQDEWINNKDQIVKQFKIMISEELQ